MKPFEHDLGAGRHHQLVADALDQLGATVPQQSRRRRIQIEVSGTGVTAPKNGRRVGALRRPTPDTAGLGAAVGIHENPARLLDGLTSA